jgi:hypothetical protein
MYHCMQANVTGRDMHYSCSRFHEWKVHLIYTYEAPCGCYRIQTHNSDHHHPFYCFVFLYGARKLRLPSCDVYKFREWRGQRALAVAPFRSHIALSGELRSSSLRGDSGSVKRTMQPTLYTH